MLRPTHSRPGKILAALAVYNPLAARYISQTLRSDPGIETVCARSILGDNHSAPKAVSVFVLDRGTLPLSVPRYLRYVHSRCPDTPAILLDEPRSNEEVCRLLFLGIQGFMAYAEVEERLAAAIRSICEGHLWIPPEVVEQYVRSSNRFAQRAARRGTVLTPREREVFHLLRQRLTNKEIASALEVSESAVKFHLGNIFSKLGTHDRHALAESTIRDEVALPLVSGESFAGKAR